jgi:very-short-patch-repair endonuclease
MTTLLLTAALVLVVIVVAAAILKQRGGTKAEPDRYPFEQCRPLSEQEQVLFWLLRKVLPDQMVLSQVALSQILRVSKGHNSRAWRNRIDRMSIDFLVCLQDASIVAAIELDDSSHKRKDRVAADAKKTKALESAGIKLIRFRQMPTEEELRLTFL